MEKIKEIRENQYGSYQEITREKEILDITTTTKHCILHFYHADFKSCLIMDNHLEVKTSTYLFLLICAFKNRN